MTGAGIVHVGVTHVCLLEGTGKLTKPKTHYAKIHTGTRTHTSGEDKGTLTDEMLSLSQRKRDTNNTREALLLYARSQTHTLAYTHASLDRQMNMDREDSDLYQASHI